MSLHALRSQSRDAPHANTAAPLPDTSSPQPRATNTVERGGPGVAPTIREDHLLISESDRRAADVRLSNASHLPLPPLSSLPVIISVCVVIGATAVILGAVCCVQ